MHNLNILSGSFMKVSTWLTLEQLLRSLTTRVQSPAWSRVELWVTFFRHTVRGQGR